AGGVAAVVLVGWAVGGSPVDGLVLLTLPHGLDLAPFVAAPVASGMVTVAASLSRRPRPRPEEARSA
ncbi:MAG: hypothetical protein M3245_02220, partial [Actinomycetota bacterium]|nr:hypothetical protein [Actinomycetota bacterium]